LISEEIPKGKFEKAVGSVILDINCTVLGKRLLAWMITLGYRDWGYLDE
jgi:hypothetical protein